MLERALSYVKIEEVLKDLPLALKMLCPPDDNRSDDRRKEARLFFLKYVVIEMLQEMDFQHLDGEEAENTEKQILAAIAEVSKINPSVYIESN
jgi:hypothetical protein